MYAESYLVNCWLFSTSCIKGSGHCLPGPLVFLLYSFQQSATTESSFHRPAFARYPLANQIILLFG